MRRKIYVAPSANRKGGYPNPYFIHLKKELASYFEVLDSENKPRLSQGLTLLRYSFSADVFLLSFVETIAFHKLAFIQCLAAMLSLVIMKLRRREVIFIFHNPRPHKGENWMSRSLTMRMLRQAVLVLSHSTDTAAYAKSLISNFGGDPAKVKYVCHPMPATDVPAPDMSSHRILIWGNVLPYKGILEFVSHPEIRDAGLDVHIVGRCSDASLSASIEQSISLPSSTHFLFENRSASFEELRSLIPSSKYVVFPYLPGSVSGSGVLMDTIAMGGEPVGPSFGAFADLASDNVCRIYHSIPELVSILNSPKQLNQTAIRHFISRHSWPAFAEMIAKEAGRL